MAGSNVRAMMTELICFDCSTDLEAVPGPDQQKAAVTLHEGTAVCLKHANARREAAATARA